MVHDPMCPALEEMGAERLFRSTSRKWFLEHPCLCQFLKPVRSDSRQKTLDAAREAVWTLHDDGSDRTMSGKKQPDDDYYWAIDDACAAIDALRGE